MLYIRSQITFVFAEQNKIEKKIFLGCEGRICYGHRQGQGWRESYFLCESMAVLHFEYRR